MEQKIESVVAFIREWLNQNVLTWDTALQWACVAAAFCLALVIWGVLKKLIVRWMDDNIEGDLARTIINSLVRVGRSLVFILLAQICAGTFWDELVQPRVLIAASDLAVAWILIRLVTGMMPNQALARGAANTVWTVAALHVFGLLTPVTDFLENLSFSTGGSSVTALGVIKGLLLAAVLLQAASIAARFAVRRIESIKDLSPSLQVLLSKAVKVCLFTAALLFAMSSVGIDLTSLAIFSSALGVGIGFGLKTIFSNYISGVLLLVDNSIKPGDTIEVGGVFGVVHEMHSRYASILTRNGKEHLIPNEVLITGEVVNWTYSDSNVRLKIPVGIAYDSDVEKAMELLVEAAKKVGRVLADPGPAARLVGFGDNSVDLQLRVWIADSPQGVTNVRSEVMLNIWRLFHENGIEFPFPQRDVLLKPDSQLSVNISRSDNDE
ncbi:mechanosensitive ion channel domain-containing protein [uncultured Pseudodesulfovibrio sp.]|uniref:mechanosensitive ion channel family protein n=1 Tax=uncultured Pseudodesulfovibrio sp. TaxID=2035858 RepID=UPI0029C81DD6|nr:mechanosensitive ion channel domain-containing protein [uncultured Pseudodesulfovibrio sp.]